MENAITEIIVMRHGETEWNASGRQQGQLDSVLSEQGVLQAQKTARYLRGQKFDALYSSDLGRTMQTAQILAEALKLKIIPVPGLRERNLGIVQGLTLAEFSRDYPEEYARYTSGDPDYIIPKGESIRQRYDRTLAAMRNIISDNRGERILAVVHGGNLDSLFRHIVGVPLSQKRNFSLINASLNVFIAEETGWKLKTWGQVSHLESVNATDDY